MNRVYRDGVTNYNEPFWDNYCDKCAKRFWSVTLDCVCPNCGNSQLYILNESQHIKHSKEELAKFDRKIMEGKE